MIAREGGDDLAGEDTVDLLHLARQGRGDVMAWPAQTDAPDEWDTDAYVCAWRSGTAVQGFDGDGHPAQVCPTGLVRDSLRVVTQMEYKLWPAATDHDETETPAVYTDCEESGERNGVETAGPPTTVRDGWGSEGEQGRADVTRATPNEGQGKGRGAVGRRVESAGEACEAERDVRAVPRTEQA